MKTTGTGMALLSPWPGTIVSWNKIEAETFAIPPDLDMLYHELVQDMDERRVSWKLIQWICFAMRPLSLDELRWAMIVDPLCPYKSLKQRVA